MLGLTKKKLCEGVCSEKTIGRLEANKTKPQLAVVRRLFEKMNLSGEYQRWQIATNDVRAFPIYDEIRRSANNREFERIKRLLVELEKYVPMENPINRQYKERIEVIVERRQEKISNEEAKKRLMEILKYTIPYEAAIKGGIKYITNVEVQILLDIAINIGRANMNCAFETLLKLCEQIELDEGILEHIAVRETIMTTIANVYGEMGKYTKADMINLRTMQEGICCYRMNMLVPNLYGIIWNNGERVKKNMPIKEEYKEKDYLHFCLILCKINKDTVKETIVKRRLKGM